MNIQKSICLFACVYMKKSKKGLNEEIYISQF